MSRKAYWAAGCIALLCIGVAVPKLTVRDLVPLTEEEKACAYRMFDFSGTAFTRALLALGKGQIVEKQSAAEFSGRAYTLFRIPIGFLYGAPGEMYTISCLKAAPGSGQEEPQELADGDREWLGVFRDSAVVGGEKSYSSDELGMSLRYPGDYLLFEHEPVQIGSSEMRLVTIAEEGPALESIARARAGIGSEGPPTISFAFYSQPEDVPLEEWIRTDPRANFALPLPPWEEGENTMMATSVAGQPAYAYENDGLYWYHYVVFKHRGWIVVAAGASLDTTPNPAFSAILSSVELR